MRGANKKGGFASFFFKHSTSRPASRSEIDSAPLLYVSSPTDFKRTGHISYRAATGVFSGLTSDASLFFGVPASSQPRIEVSGYVERIPSILTLLLEELIKRDGLITEGIFRIPAEVAALDRSRKALDSGRGMFSLEDETGPHVIASLIKDWFKSLSDEDSLFSKLSLEELSHLASDEHSDDVVYQKMRDCLAEPNRSLFAWVIDMLSVVCYHKEKNLMGPVAIATVFAPSLRYTEQNIESFAVISNVANIIERCILSVLSGSEGLSKKEAIFSKVC
jgi:hypothetical protein